MSIEKMIAAAVIAELEPMIDRKLREIVEASQLGQDCLLDIKEVSKKMSLSPNTITSLVRCGEFPQPIYIGASKRWRASAVLQKLRGAATAESGGTNYRMAR